MNGTSSIALFALAAMVLFYALEHSFPLSRVGFAIACAVAASADFVTGHWPFGVVALAFGFVSARRWNSLRRSACPAGRLLTQGDGRL
jgi:hypothetical protein